MRFLVTSFLGMRGRVKLPDPSNSYKYAKNNPLNYTDPNGHFSIKKWIGKIVGAVVGAVTFVMTGEINLAMAAYGFVSGVIDTYNAGYSVGESLGIGILSGTAGLCRLPLPPCLFIKKMI